MTLTAGITGNKKNSTDARGQLLRGTDKVVGEIALKYVNVHQKLFNEIVIYGLTINLQD